MRVFDEKVLLADNRKLRKLTGWVPNPDLKRTLHDILDYWRGKVGRLYPNNAQESVLAESTRFGSVIPKPVRPLRNTAVCVKGGIGAENTTDAFQKHVVAVLNADVFIVEDTNDTIPIRTWFDKNVPGWKTTSKRGNYLDGLLSTKSPYHYGHGSLQLRDRSTCLKRIRAMEIKRGQPYVHVGMGRRDLMWMGDHPSVNVETNECWIPCPANDWGGYCDHWVLCGRQGIVGYVKGPLDMLPWKGEELNTEKHIRVGLEKTGVRVKRGNAPFFRSCKGPSRRNGVVRCKWMPRINMAGKPSGNQLSPWL
jgi:hypothetical protein